MNDESNLPAHHEPPEVSFWDAFQRLAKIAISTDPIGAAGVGLFNLMVGEPYEKRMESWKQRIAEDLLKLSNRVAGITPEVLQSAEFIDTVTQATRAAVATSQREKLDALRHGVLNSALPSAPAADIQAIFISNVDELTVNELRILKLLDDPVKWFKENPERHPQRDNMNSEERVIQSAFPDCTDSEMIGLHLFRLQQRRLLKPEMVPFQTMRQGGEPMGRKTTSLGRSFLSFISEPQGESE